MLYKQKACPPLGGACMLSAGHFFESKDYARACILSARGTYNCTVCSCIRSHVLFHAPSKIRTVCIGAGVYARARVLFGTRCRYLTPHTYI